MNTSPLLDQPPVVSGHWTTFAAIILIFAFGCFSGGLSMSLAARHRASDTVLRGDIGSVLQRRLMRDIVLDSDQKKSVHAVIAANSRQRASLQLQIHPQIQALDRDTVARLDAVLNPEQREQFHRNIDELKQRLGTKVFDPGAESAPVSPAAATSSP